MQPVLAPTGCRRGDLEPQADANEGRDRAVSSGRFHPCQSPCRDWKGRHPAPIDRGRITHGTTLHVMETYTLIPGGARDDLSIWPHDLAVLWVAASPGDRRDSSGQAQSSELEGPILRMSESPRLDATGDRPCRPRRISRAIGEGHGHATCRWRPRSAARIPDSSLAVLLLAMAGLGAAPGRRRGSSGHDPARPAPWRPMPGARGSPPASPSSP